MAQPREYELTRLATAPTLRLAGGATLQRRDGSPAIGFHLQQALDLPSPTDHDLLFLVAAFDRQHAVVMSIPEDDEKALIAAEAAERVIVRQIEAVTPATLAGWKARARVVLAQLGERYEAGMYIGNDLAGVWALLRDLSGEDA